MTSHHDMEIFIFFWVGCGEARFKTVPEKCLGDGSRLASQPKHVVVMKQSKSKFKLKVLASADCGLFRQGGNSVTDLCGLGIQNQGPSAQNQGRSCQ